MRDTLATSLTSAGARTRALHKPGHWRAGCILLSLLLSGCQTTGRALQSIGNALAPVTGTTQAGSIGGIALNPWPVFGALLFIAGVAWGALTRDWRTATGAMAGGAVMGFLGIALSHPYAPVIGLVMLVTGAGFAIRKHLLCKKSE